MIGFGELTFAYPWVLWGLVALPLLAAWRLVPRWRGRRTGTFLFSRASILVDQRPTWRTICAPLPDLLVIAALALGLIALARPQKAIAQEVDVDGIDIYLALDMSGSMRAIDMSMGEIRALARRGQEPPNRFEGAISTLKRFVSSRAHDRIGMIVFARADYLQFPLTLDYNTILSMLDRLKLGDIDEGGTAIGNAIGRAIKGMMESEAETRIVILITDGDRRGGNISPRRAAEWAAEREIKVFPILMGREGAALIPAGKNLLSGHTTYREREFPVNPALLQEIADKTGGEFFKATDAEGLEQRLHEILDRFERTRVQDTSHVDYQERYHPWLVWAIAMMAAQFALRHTLLRKFP